MTLFSFIFAMLLEQFRPVRDDSAFAKRIEQLFLRVERSTNSGEMASARLSWPLSSWAWARPSWVRLRASAQAERGATAARALRLALPVPWGGGAEGRQQDPGALGLQPGCRCAELRQGLPGGGALQPQGLEDGGFSGGGAVAHGSTIERATSSFSRSNCWAVRSV